ncbi:elongation factor P 5-aminopentanone reductase [Thalassobacillus devorans]|uniref:elongation factor P 5-aminopentanone reductase n=1 Tax=Thalassobacillus devorans TaxID=279813 RepID=UPI000490D3F8|nr:SDR family oxidoreductase [Thalassobacillus devorans]
MSHNILIMGASGDIGSAITRVLAERDQHVFLQYHSNENSITQLENSIPKEQWLGAVKANLETSAGIHDFLENLPIHIDGVVFAGGSALTGLFQDMTEMDMDQLFHLHVKTPWLVTRHLLPSMVRQRYGRIILLSSIWGDIGASMEVLYSSVKGAQNSFVKALAKETARSGIAVNGVSPGFIDTKMNGGFNDEERASLLEEIPSGRAGRPEEVAKVVGFLLSEDASYINGEIIKVNGAWS